MIKFLHFLARRETLAPTAALAFASVVSIGLITTRVFVTHKLSYGFLVWNLFLAWMPLGFALLAKHEFEEGPRRRWVLLGLGAAWLLFFPNAPYICTDVVHLKHWFYQHFWIDLCLILIFAFTGLVIGFMSLYWMQSLVSQIWGRAAGWVFVFATAGLSSVGVYIGRFLRFNSWDVLLRPGGLFRGLGAWSQHAIDRQSLGFLLLFAAFLFVAYVMLYGLTHLAPAQQRAAAA